MTTSLKPGQTELNDLETAVLKRMVDKLPSLLRVLPHLRVLSREFTGVGAYTRFYLPDSIECMTNERFLDLDGAISLPDVPHGLGAILFFESGKPHFLEFYTYGDEHWEGRFDGFSISGAA